MLIFRSLYPCLPLEPFLYCQKPPLLDFQKPLLSAVLSPSQFCLQLEERCVRDITKFISSLIRSGEIESKRHELLAPICTHYILFLHYLFPILCVHYLFTHTLCTLFILVFFDFCIIVVLFEAINSNKYYYNVMCKRVSFCYMSIHAI